MPTVAELAQQELDKRRVQQVSAFQSSYNPFNPNFRATVGSKLRELIDDSGIGGGYKQGLINAGNTIEAGIDFTPIVGDAVGVGDIRTSYNQGDMLGTGINTVAAAVGALPIVGDYAAKGVKSAGSALRDLYFLHNTTPQALARYDQLGGLPAPSIAVTQEDIPFENFGDITLIGRPERFAPEADKANTVWGSDAYTVRAPKPFRIPAPDAKDNFLKDFKNIEQSDKYEAEYLIDELSRTPTNPSQLYDEFDSWLESRNDALKKFAHDNNISAPKDAGWADLRKIREDNREAFDLWKEGEINKYFQPEQYFDASSKNSSRVNIKPYTNEYIIPYMKRSSGAGTEETSTMGVGKIRSALQPRLKSLEEIRQSRSALSDAISDSNISNESLLIEAQNALKPYYKWPDGDWQMRNDVGTALSNSGRLGIKSALEKEGFENVPDSLIENLNKFTDDLIKSPTTYFESKPMRQVGIEEFSGAIVPRNTPESSLRLLESKNIPYTLYDPESPTDRLLARKQFRDSAFMLGGLGAGTAAYMNQQPTQPQPDS